MRTRVSSALTSEDRPSEVADATCADTHSTGIARGRTRWQSRSRQAGL